MVWQHVRVALLAGAAVALFALPTLADEPKKDTPPAITGGAGRAPAQVPAPIPAPTPAPVPMLNPPTGLTPPPAVMPAPMAAPVASDCGSPCGSPCGPTYRTICVTEYTQEVVPCTRTVYKTEYRQEAYTAYRCESIPETRTRTFTVSRMVPEAQQITKNVCVTVPVTEERTVMESFVSCRPVTTMVCKTVDQGHYECREVPADCGSSGSASGIGGKLRGLCGRHKKSECATPCSTGCSTGCSSDCGDCGNVCAVPMKTVKVWVPCLVTEQVPCTKMERVCEQRAVKKCFTTYRTETRQETCTVMVNRCVTEQKTEAYTVMTSRSVPYQATRCVAVCVPTTETYNVTRCVPHTVTKQVAVETGCGGCGAADSCGGGCGACAATTCGSSSKHKLFGGHSHGHSSGCSTCN